MYLSGNIFQRGKLGRSYMGRSILSSLNLDMRVMGSYSRILNMG